MSFEVSDLISEVDAKQNDDGSVWKVLVVDDEEEVHRLTQMVLDDYTFEGRGLQVLAAYSGRDAIRMIESELDIALVMLDVVMETDDAGLRVVKHIREKLKNDIIQIVLRTGQPGLAPPQEIIAEYNINSYNSKVELTAQKVFTIVTASLRAYKLGSSLKLANEKLRHELIQRRRAEEKVQRLNAFQKNVIDNTVFWLSVFDIDGNVVVWNKAAEAISGYDYNELHAKGAGWEVLFPDDEQLDTVKKAFFHQARMDLPVEHFEAEITCKDGTKKTIAWHFRSYNEVTAAETGTILLGRDVTEVKKLESQFLQAQKMEAVGRLAGGISHDFNNMLTVIRGHCELLMVRLLQDDPVFEKVEQIDRAAERAENLTRQILAFSRHRVVKPVHVDLREVVEGMRELFDRIIGNSIKVSLKVDELPCRVTADPGQLEQVIMNLVVNACDAMPDGGLLRITVERSPEAEPIVRLIVADDGVGMTDEVIENIFEPFYTTKEKGKGTGLGLSTVYGIVRQNNGHVKVESAVGAGTRFLVSFPETSTSVRYMPVKEPDISRELYGTETILVVEDQKEVLEMAGESLRYYGYKVLEARNAGSALLICEQQGDNIDIMLTDVKMDLMDGTQLAGRVKTLYPEIRILFMSGYAENIDENDQLVDPDVNFIQKPFVLKKLLSMIRSAMEAPAPIDMNHFL